MLRRNVFLKVGLVIVVVLAAIIMISAGSERTGESTTKPEAKFREIPPNWIMDLEEKLSERRMTTTGPNGEPVTSAEDLTLSLEEIEAAKKINMQYVYMGATLDITEILNKVGMDEVLASIEKPPINFMGCETISEQIDQINTLTSRAKEINFVIAQAYEAETTGPPFVELARAGVPQFHNWTTPRGVANEQNYIGLADADGYGEGFASAEILAYMMNYKGEVGLMPFALEHHSCIQRFKGAKETFAKYPDIKIVAVQGYMDPGQGREIALGMLQAHPEIDAIYCDWMAGPATGAAEAVIELGRVGEVIIAAPDLGGITGARFIADPNHPIVGAAANDCIEMGRCSSRAAIKWVLGKQDEVSGIYTCSKIIPIVRANLVDGFYKQTRGALGELPRDVLELLEK